VESCWLGRLPPNGAVTHSLPLETLVSPVGDLTLSALLGRGALLQILALNLTCDVGLKMATITP
jgi:hypothetical protein